MRRFFLGLILAAMAAGCGSGHNLEGKWNATQTGDMPPGTQASMTLAKPNQLAIDFDIPRDMAGSKTVHLQMHVQGTYTLEGEYMTMHADDVKMSATDLPPSVKAMVEGTFNSLADNLKTSINSSGKTKIVWNGKDSFSLQDSKGKPQTFTRAN